MGMEWRVGWKGKGMGRKWWREGRGGEERGRERGRERDEERAPPFMGPRYPLRMTAVRVPGLLHSPSAPVSA